MAIRFTLVIVWHLMPDPSARFVDLGSDFYQRQVKKDRRTRSLVHQIQAFGYQVSSLNLGTSPSPRPGVPTIVLRSPVIFRSGIF